MYNVLVVDDEKEITDAIEVYLKNQNYNVFKAYDGIQALEIFDREEIHLVLIDIMMPGLDGTKTTIKIREKSPVPIIFLSAKSEDMDKILGLNIGADDYIKTFNLWNCCGKGHSSLRRYKYSNNGASRECTENRRNELRDDSKELIVDGDVVKITPGI